MTLNDRVEINPKIMLGKPVIRGTRITVELIVRKLGEGAKNEDLLNAYPHLNLEDIRAALAYAAVKPCTRRSDPPEIRERRHQQRCRRSRIFKEWEEG